MNSTDVVGYAYEADLHCTQCAEDRFGAAKLMDNENPPEDGEGNPVSPVFAGEDAYEQCDHCSGLGTCTHDGRDHACPQCDATGECSRRCGDCTDPLID